MLLQNHSKSTAENGSYFMQCYVYGSQKSLLWNNKKLMMLALKCERLTGSKLLVELAKSDGNLAWNSIKKIFLIEGKKALKNFTLTMVVTSW